MWKARPKEILRRCSSYQGHAIERRLGEKAPLAVVGVRATIPCPGCHLIFCMVPTAQLSEGSMKHTAPCVDIVSARAVSVNGTHSSIQ